MGFRLHIVNILAVLVFPIAVVLIFKPQPCKYLITHFMPLVPFCTTENLRKPFGWRENIGMK